MSKLSFKVYLLNENACTGTGTEVRRFGVDADVATNLMYLREKLQIIFPDLRGKNFLVTWKDDENETVIIATNEELEIALMDMSKNDINKLYILLQPERDESKIEKTLHPGVVCDVCDKNIRGFRFKCMECSDYDLCLDCMNHGNHPEHYMVRMTQPVEWSSYHGRRLAYHVRKFVKKSQHSREDEARKCSHKSKRGGCPAFIAHGKRGPYDPSFADVLENIVTDFCSSDGIQEQKRTKEQHREPSAEAATEATEDPRQEATRHSFSQLLKIVEDNISNISQFLDPLGITVTVMADDFVKKPADDAQAKTAAQKPESQASTSAENSAKKFPGEGKKLRDDPVSTEAAPSTDDAALQKDSAAATATAAATETATAAAAAISAEQAAEAEEWTMIHRESPNSSRASSIGSNGNGTKQATPPPSMPTAPMAEPEKTPSNQKIYPPLPEEVRHELYHPNPKIQRAVEMMMTMGFSNEGGWLTHLLAAQNGDIDKALDVIHPVRRH